MADRMTTETTDVPELDEVLEDVLIYAIEKARETLEGGEDVVPFTALAVGETLFLENHPAETAEACFTEARHTVQGAQGALCYALCYDGYVDTDEGQKDALIAEGGMPAELEGHAIGLLYTETEEGIIFDEDIVYVGNAPNFMLALTNEPYVAPNAEEEADSEEASDATDEVEADFEKETDDEEDDD